MTNKELLERSVRFQFHLPNEIPSFVGSEYAKSPFFVELRNKKENLWAIVYSQSVFDKRSGMFEYEPSPSNRDDDFLENTRFSFEEAIEIAAKIEDNTIKPFELAAK